MKWTYLWRMRLLTLVKRMYIQWKDITDKVNQRTEKNDCLNQSIIPQTCIYLTSEWSILTSCWNSDGMKILPYGNAKSAGANRYTRTSQKNIGKGKSFFDWRAFRARNIWFADKRIRWTIRIVLIVEGAS